MVNLLWSVLSVVVAAFSILLWFGIVAIVLLLGALCIAGRVGS